MKSIVMILCGAVSLMAQSAKVVQLSQTDSDHAKAAYEAMHKAQDEWAAIQSDIEHKYASDSREEVDYGSAVLSSSDAGTLWYANKEFECASKDASIFFDQESQSLKARPLDAACEQARKKREAERELARVKSAQELEERRKNAPMKTIYTAKPGWEYGFEFDADFQFIVPNPAPSPAVGRQLPLCLGIGGSNSLVVQ